MKKIFISSTTLLVALTLVGTFFVRGIVSATEPTPTCANPIHIASWEGCEPIVTTAGVVSTDKYSAVVNAFYSSNGADYNSTDRPSLSVEYGLNSGEFDNSSKAIDQNKGSTTVGFLLEGLQENQKYKYRAVLSWVGGIKYGEIKTFVAQKQTTTTTTTTTTNSTTTDTTTVVPAPVVPSTTGGGIFNWFNGGSKKTTTATPTLPANIDEKSGFRLAIDDGETTVAQGDEVTIKVRYENNNSKTYTSGSVQVYLAPQYAFTASNKGIYDRVDNTVVISLRDFPGGGFGTAIITAKANGKPGDLDQAISQAVMKVNGVTLKVSDIDEYGSSGSSSKGVLGASASGAGFLPGSLIGWIVLLVVLALVVIIGRRYFTKKDY